MLLFDQLPKVMEISAVASSMYVCTLCTCTTSSPTRGGACWKNSFHALNTCVKMYQLISFTKLDSTSTFKKLVAGSHDLAAGLNNSCFSFLLPIIISYTKLW